ELHSLPTRRSSDLHRPGPLAAAVASPRRLVQRPSVHRGALLPGRLRRPQLLLLQEPLVTVCATDRGGTQRGPRAPVTGRPEAERLPPERGTAHPGPDPRGDPARPAFGVRPAPAGGTRTSPGGARTHPGHTMTDGAGRPWSVTLPSKDRVHPPRIAPMFASVPMNIDPTMSTSNPGNSVTAVIMEIGRA